MFICKQINLKSILTNWLELELFRENHYGQWSKHTELAQSWKLWGESETPSQVQHSSRSEENQTFIFVSSPLQMYFILCHCAKEVLKSHYDNFHNAVILPSENIVTYRGQLDNGYWSISERWLLDLSRL